MINIKNFNLLSLLISIFAITISIVAICGYSSDGSYIGWIIAVLPTLILFLVGWNIYQVIDTKSTISDQNKIIETIKNEQRNEFNTFKTNYEERLKEIEQKVNIVEENDKNIINRLEEEVEELLDKFEFAKQKIKEAKTDEEKNNYIREAAKIQVDIMVKNKKIGRIKTRLEKLSKNLDESIKLLAESYENFIKSMPNNRGD